MYTSLPVRAEDMGATVVYELQHVNQAEGYGTAQVLGRLPDLAAMPEGPLVRIHSRCVYGEVFDSVECDCGPQFRVSRRLMAQDGAGIFFYLEGQEGRGAGLSNKAEGYKLTQTEGLDTYRAYERLGVPFDQREYGHCARFLEWAGISKVRLLTNNQHKIGELGLAEVVRVPLIVGVSSANVEYLRTKRDVDGHLFSEDM
jgi:3,4-dihydroxy 2-butanone 4-phosphate synthase/GTP cyclohydrolase II